MSGEVVEYQYDSIHRLTSATTTAGTAWGQSFVYDGFGNMKQKIGTGLAVGTSFNISLNSAKNNAPVGGDPGDIDNRIVTGPTGETYSYAPDNKRIAKTLTGGAGTQWFLWVGGMRIGTYTHNWNAGTSQWVLASSKEDWYVAGRRVAPSDRLGSDLTSGLKLMPYGEEIQPPNVPNDKTKFATYHRDASGLDYADQRYYSPGTGRFMTSDPYLASGSPGSPTSWNRFAYVVGDPVNLVDPEGRAPCGSSLSTLPDGTFHMDVFDCVGLVAGGFAIISRDGSDNGQSTLQNLYESGGCSLSDGSPCYPEGWQTVLDGVQNLLGLAGFVPGLGALPDLLNASISAARGDGSGAMLSLAAALPVAGDSFAICERLSRCDAAGNIQQWSWSACSSHIRSAV